MLNRKTLIILGAGASKPYNFPTGLELRKKIIDESKELINSIHFDNKGSEEGLTKKLKDYEIHFLSTFRSATNVTIDEFLLKEINAKDPNSKPCGLRLMLSYLLKCKSESQILDGAWIEFLIDSTFRGRNKLYDENNCINESFEKLKIITFNYERSFENYLISSVTKYGYNENEAICFIRYFSKNILHIYGIIGNLFDTYPSNDGIKFGVRLTGSKLDKLSKNIKLIYDERKAEEETVQKFVSDVEQIFFLGFGYDNFNLANLKLNSVLSNKVKIFGTAKGLTFKIDGIKSRILEQNNNFVAENIIIENVDCKTLLEKHFD